MCPVERREIIDSKVHGGGVYRLKINPCDKCRNDFCINYRLDHKSTGGQRQSLNSFLPSSILLHVFLPSSSSSPLPSSPFVFFSFSALFKFQTQVRITNTRNDKDVKWGSHGSIFVRPPKPVSVNKYSISNQAIFFPLLPTNLPPIFAPSL